MKRISNPGYWGNPWMPSQLFNDITQYGSPTPPPPSDARITDADDLRITDARDPRVTD